MNFKTINLFCTWLNFQKLKIKSATILFCLLYIFAGAQLEKYYFKNYQSSNGLSSNTITCITQDNNGFMWFGTRNGLNRFDGYTFKTFRNNSSDPFSIGNNSILSLAEDEKHLLWVGTYRGIFLYDPTIEKFSFFKKIPAVEVRYIKEDKEHNLWIVANFILYSYNEKTKILKEYHLNNSQIISLNISENGVLWIATNNGILKKYNASKDIFINYNLTFLLKTKSGNQIQDICSVSDSILFIGTFNSALLVNLNTLKSINIFKKYSWGNDVQTHKIFRQTKDEYWFETEKGLIIYNIVSGLAKGIQKEYDNPFSISDNTLYSYYKDQQGGTWLGTFFGGVNYYCEPYNRFEKYFKQYSRNNLSGNIVHEICADKKGNIWVGTEDAGLNKIEVNAELIKHFEPGNNISNISFNNIHGLLATENELWIGTYEHGLDVMNLETAKVIRHYNRGTGTHDLSSNFIVSLFQTKSREILVGTWNGLFKYNRAKDNFTPLPFYNLHIQAIYEDEKQLLWICTYGSGVYIYDRHTNQIVHLEYKADNFNSILNNYVNNIYEDNNRNFWFATEGGLSKYNTTSKVITNYTTKDGLPDNQIFKILQDNNNNLWISTAKGLVCFDFVKNRMQIYTTVNGLISDQFNYNSAFKNKDGSLFFGSIKGLIHFNPANFKKDTFTPPVYITAMEVNNQNITANEPNSFLKKSIIYSTAITLPYDHANIALDIAALSYSAPEINSYTYKLEGFDKDWTKISSTKKIYYNKLLPGKYIFKVKGASSEGVWNEKETTLAINITPPWWQTNWAYLFYFIALTTIIFIIFYYYQLSVKEKNKRNIDIFEIAKERQIYNAKIEFFTNIAHEIRTPLTLIKMPLDKLLKTHIHTSEVNKSLQMIDKNTTRLIDLTNQLLDFRKVEANNYSLSFTETNIVDLLHEIFNNFKPAAEEKNLKFSLEYPKISLHAYVDSEALKKILSNLFNNAIKYADNIVEVKLLPFSSDDNFFNIEVKNDGFVIPMELKEKIFESFYRIKETENKIGTGIGLPLSRALAKLHSGTLELKKRDDNINIFLLSLPIHQQREISINNNEETPDITQNTENKEPFDLSKPLVLLVEDNKEILNFIEGELSFSYNILKAYDGQEAFEILEKENVQLVISDIMMPVMDGIELCKKIKTDIQFSHIPIILLTAKNSVYAKIEGLEVGADAYIEKPFNIDHLQAQITSLLANRTYIKEYYIHSPLAHLRGIACSNADKKFLEHLNQIIYENITNSDLDVDTLSRLMNMSRTTLYRKINALSNITPNELINVTRLKKAAELLAEGQYKINEIANMIGYTLQSNFARDFHKQFNITPSNYIKKIQDENK
jgi:ligand-binding sensor domain-containing protein/signal transduction histidine kinase/DNA-binding response OmpR family regulator